MQFTKAEEYGIFGIMYLATQTKGKITPLSEISENQHVPEKFLAKIFQSLCRSGLVRSHRGVKGGFSLGRTRRQNHDQRGCGVHPGTLLHFQVSDGTN